MDFSLSFYAGEGLELRMSQRRSILESGMKVSGGGAQFCTYSCSEGAERHTLAPIIALARYIG